MNIQHAFDLQQANKWRMANTSVRERVERLKRLERALAQDYLAEIQEALNRDLGKHPTETYLTEIFATISEIKHIRRNLRTWTKEQSVSTPLPLIGSSAWVRYEAKGVCLIISPWNFPVLLTFGPLASAIAAGNTAILKPSEMTPNTSALMGKIVKDLFEEEEVALFEGAKETATELLNLPFDHIFFTGSPAIGKVVMAAAAKHLTSVTLELGGKSPTIVDETADLKTAAQRIAWAKLMNAGQICIAPDYVLVHERVQAEFLKHLADSTRDQYGTDPVQSDNYAKMVNQRHAERVAQMWPRECRVVDGKVAPTVVLNPPLDSAVMQEEIFGPILPVVTYRHLDEAVRMIQGKEKPLALYIFSNSSKNTRYVLANTSAGGTCINHCAVHFFNSDLPFGGVRFSGHGKGHGIHGFREFSNARSVHKQHIVSVTDILRPPYTGWKQKILNLAVRWL